MTVVSSFTLCPPSSDKSLPHHVMDMSGASRLRTCPPSKKRKEMTSSPMMQGPTFHVMGSGYGMPSSYQATPFHPLPHQRQMISPLKVEEFQRLDGRAPLQPQHHHSTIDPSNNCGWSRLAADPPVSEIHIPAGGTAQEHAADDHGDDDISWIHGESGPDNDYDEHSFERLESWKSMYFVAQRDLHVARAESQAIVEENKRLKRHLFELQRRLYESQRKRQRLANDMWKVPGAPSQPGFGRDDRLTSDATRTLNQKEHLERRSAHKTRVEPQRRVPRAISSEESSSCWGDLSKSPKSQHLLPVK